MGLRHLSNKRTAALLLGTFLAGATGATLLDRGGVAPAQAQNLSAQVPDNIQAEYAPGFSGIVEKVSPAVVSIQVRSRARRQLSNFNNFNGTPFERFFEEFGERFGAEPNGRDNDQNRRRGGRNFSMGQGSGFIISTDGYIVTNGHVVSNAEEVTVSLTNGERLTAEVIGVDDKTDLALVKVDADEDLPFVTFAENETKVGDWVVAVGNPFGLGGTVTAGIVSARGREIGAGPYDDFIQIDASINRGNSGGPTFNLSGNVVGVNTAIYSPSGGSVGIGFAIPTSIAQDVIEDLKDDGNVTRGWLGVQIQSINEPLAESLGLETTVGTLVTDPQDDSPAAKAGIRAGDAILAVDGEAVESPRDLARTISNRSPGEVVTLDVWRNGRDRQIDVTLGRLPDDAGDNRERNQPRNERNRDNAEQLGMTLAPAGDVGLDVDGLAVVEIDPNGQAAASGIRVGDVILQAGGVDVTSPDDLEDGVTAADRDGRQNVLLKLQTGDNTRFVAVPMDGNAG